MDDDWGYLYFRTANTARRVDSLEQLVHSTLAELVTIANEAGVPTGGKAPGWRMFLDMFGTGEFGCSIIIVEVYSLVLNVGNGGMLYINYESSSQRPPFHHSLLSTSECMVWMNDEDSRTTGFVACL